MALTLIFPIPPAWFPLLPTWLEQPDAHQYIASGHSWYDALMTMPEHSHLVGVQNGQPCGFVVLTPDAQNPTMAEVTIYAPNHHRALMRVLPDWAWAHGYQTLWGKFALERVHRAPTLDTYARICRAWGWDFEGVLKIHQTGHFVGLGFRRKGE